MNGENENLNEEESLINEAAAEGAVEPTSGVEPPAVPADLEPPPGFEAKRAPSAPRTRTFTVDLASFEEIEKATGKKYGQVNALHRGKALVRLSVKAKSQLVAVVTVPYFVSKDGKVSRGDPMADSSRRSGNDAVNKVVDRLLKADEATAKVLLAKAGVAKVDTKGDYGLPMIQGPMVDDVVGFLIEHDAWLRAKAREVVTEKRKTNA